MKAKEYCELFDKLDLDPRSQAAADLLGIGRRCTYHYADGMRSDGRRVAIPLPVAKLLRLIVVCHRKGLLKLAEAA